jgi:nitrous oxide reductase accessory protein NosL
MLIRFLHCGRSGEKAKKETVMKRREWLKGAAAMGVLGATGVPALAATGDGTPQQFAPKTPPDPKPLENELQKYPKCPYCGMDRKEYHHSRHLVHYEDDLVDGTCSIHCAAISLSLNMDRGPKAIYGADYGSTEATKPLINVDKASYVIGSDVKGVMTARSKVLFKTADEANKFKGSHGGEVGNFDKALEATFADMAKDTSMIRKRRAERRAKAK